MTGIFANLVRSTLLLVLITASLHICVTANSPSSTSSSSSASSSSHADDMCSSDPSTPDSNSCAANIPPPATHAHGISRLSLSHDPATTLYVIATIFNPIEYASRYTLYHQFRQYVEATPNAVLITVECIFPILGQKEFQVTQADNPRHIQLISPTVLWVKEDMINYAVRRLPADALYVAWIDADVQFHHEDWVPRTITALQSYAVVQMYQVSHFLGPDPVREILYRQDGFGYSHVHKINKFEWPHPGYAWATRVSSFHAMGGLPDFHIVGNADQDVCYAYLNRSREISYTKMHPDYEICSTKKQERIYHALQSETKLYNLVDGVGYVQTNLSHFWHGKWKDRGYEKRKLMLVVSQFNPQLDLTGFSEEDPCPGRDQWGLTLRQLDVTLDPDALGLSKPQAAKQPAVGAAKPKPKTARPVAGSKEAKEQLNILRLRRLQKDLIRYFSSRNENNAEVKDAGKIGLVWPYDPR